jgi:DNA-directed RNA polymerase specialized sigma24 family protein
MVTLTPRQDEVRKLVYEQGQPYATVADWLGVTYHTVNDTVKVIRAKYAAAGQPLPDKRRHFVTH